MDQNGYVTVVADKGSVGGRAVASEIVIPSPNQFSYAALIDGLLAGLETAAVMVIDPVARKVYFSDDAGTAAALAEAANNTDTAKRVEFTPETGQTGKSLTWEGAAAETPVEAADLVELSGAVKPRRSAASMAAAILAAPGAVTPTAAAARMVIVDQINGKVSAIEDNTSAAVALVTITAGNSGVLQLSEPETPETAPKLIFEGGATRE